jgi:transcriptional regulator with XRE-family HTH domain
MSDLAKRLGMRIYEFRKQNRLTQSTLAEKARISNEFMSALERGAKLPSLEVLERIAISLRVGIKDLFDFDRANYRKVQALSRETLDFAWLIEDLPRNRRQKLLRIARILVGGDV